MRLVLASSLFFAIAYCVWASEKNTAPEVSSGQLTTISQFEGGGIAARDVHIWTPDGYTQDAQDGHQFSVLYMHDGQMLFDASITWNTEEWGVDEVAGELLKQGKVQRFIVVAIDNGGSDLRHVEYFPEKPFIDLKAQAIEQLYPKMPKQTPFVVAVDEVYSDEYLAFLVNDLKPYIDKNYAVHRDGEHTFVMGSSMGGLISLYAISEYPDVFGAAACISTHWPGASNPPDNPIPEAFFDYMRRSLPDPESHRIYFDHGTETLDAQYPELQKYADSIMLEKGYTDKSWTTQVFKGAAHDERSWNARLATPLTFLLGK